VISHDEDIGTQLFQLSRDDGYVIAKTDMRAYVGRHFQFLVTVVDLGVPARSAVSTVSIVFNDTCAVADRRNSATPAGDDRHSAVIVLTVSALFGTALGFSIVAVCACRRRPSRCWCVNLLGTTPLAVAFSHRVSTPHQLARRSGAFHGDVESVTVQQKLRFVVNDAATDVTVVNYLYFLSSCITNFLL